MSRRSIDERFQVFHSKNPEVFTKLVQLALKLKARGHDQVSIKMLYEHIRCSHMLVSSSDKYRLTNDYTSRYARLLMAEYPELDGFFELRELRAAAPEPLSEQDFEAELWNSLG